MGQPPAGGTHQLPQPPGWGADYPFSAPQLPDQKFPTPRSGGNFSGGMGESPPAKFPQTSRKLPASFFHLSGPLLHGVTHCFSVLINDLIGQHVVVIPLAQQIFCGKSGEAVFLQNET